MVDITDILEKINKENIQIEKEKNTMNYFLSFLPTLGKIQKGEWIYVAHEKHFNFDRSGITYIADFGKVVGNEMEISRNSGISIDLEPDNFVLWYVPEKDINVVRKDIEVGNHRGIIYEYLDGVYFEVETDRRRNKNKIWLKPEYDICSGEKSVKEALHRYAVPLPKFLEDFSKKYQE